MMQPLVPVVLAKLGSYRPIANILKSNHAFQSFGGIRYATVDAKGKKPATVADQTVIKGVKDISCSDDESSVQSEHIENKKDVQKQDVEVPEFFNVVLENQLKGDKDIDSTKFSSFKEFVEDTGITYLPSVSTILSRTQPKTQKDVLKRWKERMVKELEGGDIFDQYQTGIRDKGLNVHQCIELYLKGKAAVKIKEGNEGFWKSFLTVLEGINEVKIIEEECVHPEIFYRGKFDCIANFRDNICLIEWKTSSKPKPLLYNTYEHPVQVAAYIGAVNRSGILKKHGIPHITHGAIVIGYPSGEPATVHIMSPTVCDKYWQQWLERTFMYWSKQYADKHT